MSDSNPQRFEQTELFEKWLGEKHPELVKRKDLPPFGVKLSAANNQSTIIQAVSGVAGDLIDHLNVPIFAAMGLLKPLGADAKKQGFDLSKTYPNMEALLGYEGEQYGYPCNVAVSSFIFNEDTLKRYGMRVPREPSSRSTSEVTELTPTTRHRQSALRMMIVFTTPTNCFTNGPMWTRSSRRPRKSLRTTRSPGSAARRFLISSTATTPRSSPGAGLLSDSANWRKMNVSRCP